LGAIVSALSVCITPFLAIALLAKFALMLADSSAVSHVFLGIRAGTAALIAASLVGIARQALKGRAAWALAIVGFVATVIFQVNAALVVAVGLGIGLVMVFWKWREGKRG